MLVDPGARTRQEFPLSVAGKSKGPHADGRKHWKFVKASCAYHCNWRSLHIHHSKKKQRLCKVRSVGSKQGRPPEAPCKIYPKYQCLGLCGPEEALEVGTVKLDLSNSILVIPVMHREKKTESIREMGLIRAHSTHEERLLIVF